MKSIRAMLLASVLAGLGGCVAVPVDPGYYAGPPVYVARPAPYYAAPAYSGPTIGFGIYGGRRRYGHH